MALTERLAILIDARSGGAVREFQKVGRAADDLGDRSTLTGRALDRLGLSGRVSGAALKAGVATAAVAAGAAILKFGADAGRATSDLTEQVNASQTVFGRASDAVVRFSTTTRDSLGLSQRAALEAANQFGAFFKNVGFGEESTAQFSEGMVRLAADLASFKNVAGGAEEVALALRSGLSGEAEPLRRFGVFLNEAKVKNEALKLGLADTNGELGDGAKILARYTIILRETRDAQGDFAKTSESLANQQRILEAKTEDLKASFGQLSTPLLTGATKQLNTLADGLIRLSEATAGAEGAPKLIEEIGRALVTSFAASPALAFVDALARKLGLVKDKAEPATTSTERLNEALATYARLSGDAQTPSSDLARAIEEVKTASAAVDAEQAKVAEALETYEDRAKRAKAAIDGLNGSLLGAAGAELSFNQSKRSVSEAEQDVADAARELRVAQQNAKVLGTREAREAVIDAVQRHERARSRLREAQLRGVEASERLVDAQAAEAEALRNADGAAEKLLARYQALRRTSPELAPALDPLIAKLQAAVTLAERLRAGLDVSTGGPGAAIAEGRSRERAFPDRDGGDILSPRRDRAIAMAHGGAGTVRQPTLFLAGEGGEEDFAFAPRRKGGMAALAARRVPSVHHEWHIHNEHPVDPVHLSAEIAWRLS